MKAYIRKDRVSDKWSGFVMGPDSSGLWGLTALPSRDSWGLVMSYADAAIRYISLKGWDE